MGSVVMTNVAVNHNKGMQVRERTTRTAIKVTLDLHGCPPVSSGKKICKHTILKESTANYIIIYSWKA